jgi:hypothetical protein
VLSSGGVALRLEYAEDRDHFEKVRLGQTQPSAIQLVLLPEQADGLIASLQRQLTALRNQMSKDGKAN